MKQKIVQSIRPPSAKPVGQMIAGDIFRKVSGTEHWIVTDTQMPRDLVKIVCLETGACEDMLFACLVLVPALASFTIEW